MSDENRKMISKQHKEIRGITTKNDLLEKDQLKIQINMRDFYTAKTPGKETIDRNVENYVPSHKHPHQLRDTTMVYGSPEATISSTKELPKEKRFQMKMPHWQLEPTNQPS
eukprot:15356001-Ditylum_brightwellii.AAC.1